jgi:gliding motility-associated-like protein
MKKTLITLGCLFALAMTAFSAHIIGGEMRYTYVGPGTAPNSKLYRITMLLFRGDDPVGATLTPTYIIAIYNNDNNQKLRGIEGTTGDNWIINIVGDTLHVPITVPPCSGGDTILRYTYASYTRVVELPDTQNGYTVVYQTCCRINGLMNVSNNTGSTYSCSIPGTRQLGAAGHDDSPLFGVPINIICKNTPFTLDFSATDPDPGDSLVYSLCDAFNGGAAVNALFDNPAAPPYISANYLSSYSGGNPLGTFASINPKTGIITGTAPDLGRYVICVCINVYRQGVLIATHRKDLIVKVSDCILTISNPMPDLIACKDFTVQFSHASTGILHSVFWDFGDTGTLADTSILDSPSYLFPDTGIYIARLIINRGESCTDTAERTIRIYPGFAPGLEVNGSCFTNPYLFTDTTKSVFGTVNSWSWNFGDASTLADTSHLQNPVWTYPGPGPRSVSLFVTDDKGCTATIPATVDVTDKPPLTLPFKDTLICITDQVQLQALGTGVFSWTPLLDIINPGSPTPTVHPASTTWYYVQLDDEGCLNNDSVRVEVTEQVNITPMVNTTICLTDTVQLHVTGNALQYQWLPDATLSDLTIPDPLAVPTGTTTYHVTGNIGSCSDTKSVTITTVPYPVAKLGGDTIICYNTPAQLHGFHDGSVFSWSPTASLLNANTLDPIAFPPRTTEYVFTCFDNRGCPKPGRDTIKVTVLDKIIPFAGFDTTVVIFQPLHLNAEGGVHYTWLPATGLNNPNIKDPVGIYGPETDSIRYTVRVFNNAGCYDSASVKVTVFKTAPTVFVPTAFTPNGDGLNDEVYPVAAGIQRINYFRIFNRWGQLVFATTRDRHGWDGRIRGAVQGSNVFVWMVNAIDYNGKSLFLKGTLTLIR